MDYDDALAAAAQGDGLVVGQYLSEQENSCKQEQELQLIYLHIKNGLAGKETDTVQMSSTLNAQTDKRKTSLLYSSSTFRDFVPIVTIENIPTDCRSNYY